MTDMNKIFNNPLQLAASSMVRARAEPTVVGGYTDKDGDYVYVLDSGITVTAVLYDKVWTPQKREVMPFRYKGESPDKRQIRKEIKSKKK